MTDNQRIPYHLFGGDTEYPDDTAFLAYVLDKEWNLDVEEHPGYIYFDERGLARDNGPDGRGSIYIYDLGYPEGPIMGIDYESDKKMHNIGISILNKSWLRNKAWVNEIINIVKYYRRAGQSKNLNGWDYLELRSKKKTPGMTNFYGTTIEIQFVKQVAKLPYDGFANISRKEYLKQKGIKVHKGTIKETEG